MQTKTKIRILWGIVILILAYMVCVSAPQAHSATVLQPFQGGTGKGSATAGNVGDCLTVLDDSPFSYAFAECAAGAGDALTSNPLSQFAATTSLQLKDTISDETGSGALVFANSPVFTTPNIGSATGSISGNAGTATSLFANGANCSSGSSPLGVDASGAVESCFDVWTEAENTAAGYTTLAAVAGVGYLTGNQSITLSGDISGSGATAITTTIGANKVLESMLKVVDTASDEDIFTYESTTGDFEWHSGADLCVAITGSAALCDGDDASGAGAFDATQQDALTWSDGANASNIWTFDNSGTDTTMTFASGLVTFSHGVTVSGALTGTLTGNASTATALAANPADCSSNQFANAIAASGALTCGAVGDADVPNNITIDLATAASDLTCTDCINATEIEDIYVLNAGDTMGSLTLTTTSALTLGTTRWDNGSDKLDGEIIADDTIDDDSIDFADVTLADLTFDVGSVSTTEFGYLDGVTSSIQTQLGTKFDDIADFTGTLTDTKFCTYDQAGGEIDCASDAGGGTPTAITVADGGGDTTMNVGLFTDATGDLGPKTDTGLTFNGTTNALTATTFIGALTGNSSTATALAADPADCAANQFAQSIVAAGTLTCAAIADADVPNNITIDLATLASTVTVVDGTDATSFIGIYDSATGSLAPKTDGALLYAADTGNLTTTIMTATTRFAADADDGATLGASGTGFSDLFLASTAVINFGAGNATLTHSSGLLTSNVDIVVPTEVYGSSWNGSNEVPTKDAVYDKIETLGGTPFHQQELHCVGVHTAPLAYGSNTDGSVIYLICNNSDPDLHRYERDTNTGQYFQTHRVNMSNALTSSDNGSIVALGSYIYVFRNTGTNNAVTRYLAADLTGEQEMTEPTVADNDTNIAWTDGTYFYVCSGGTTHKWSLSGTTLSAVSTASCHNDIQLSEGGSMWDGTNAYVVDTASGTGYNQIKITKITTIDGSAVTTTTKTYYQFTDAAVFPVAFPIDSTKMYIGISGPEYDEAASVNTRFNLMPVTKP